MLTAALSVTAITEFHWEKIQWTKMTGTNIAQGSINKRVANGEEKAAI